MKAAATLESWMTLDEAAEYLRVTRSTLYRWMKASKLRSYKLGDRAVRVKRKDLDALLRPVPLPERKPPDAWAVLSEASFAEDWDSEEDSVYDNWEEIYGVRTR